MRQNDLSALLPDFAPNFAPDSERRQMYLYGTALQFNLHPSHTICQPAALLLRGPSRSGKSDLALRCLELGLVKLISDDQVISRRQQNQILISAPPQIAGLLEVRGVGIVKYPYHPDPVPLVLVIDLLPLAQLERLPTPTTVDIMGCPIAAAQIHAFEHSAPQKIHLILQALRAHKHDQQDYFLVSPFD